ncbi:hypothetical protein GQ600_14409 [Phytophthora cactorum]|nr:hypothetical protein GQ600_14409 [Phytophthora cactorum]
MPRDRRRRQAAKTRKRQPDDEPVRPKPLHKNTPSKGVLSAEDELLLHAAENVYIGEVEYILEHEASIV